MLSFETLSKEFLVSSRSKNCECQSSMNWELAESLNGVKWKIVSQRRQVQVEIQRGDKSHRDTLGSHQCSYLRIQSYITRSFVDAPSLLSKYLLNLPTMTSFSMWLFVLFSQHILNTPRAITASLIWTRSIVFGQDGKMLSSRLGGANVSPILIFYAPKFHPFPT